MELKKGYKQTEVGMIPEDWEVYSLGEIFGFKNGLNKGKEYFGSGTPIVNYMDVYHKRGIRNEDIKGKVSLSNQELKIYDVRKGDVFFTRTSETVEEIGLSAVILEDVESTVFSGFILRARPLKSLLDLEFCQYCFSTMIVRKAITSKSSYTTRALTNGRLLSKVKIPIPTLAEQTAIATALSDMDALITSLSTLIQKKKAIKQGAMQELLKPKEGWVVKPLDELVDVIDPHPSHRAPIEVSNGVPFLGIGDFNENGEIVKETYRVVPSTIFEEHQNRYNLNDELLGLGRVASIGKVIKFRNDIGKFTISPTMGVLKPKKAKREYLFQILKSQYATQYFTKIMSGSTRSSVGMIVLRKIPIPIPISEAEQVAIATILSDMDNEIQSLEQNLSKYQLLKQGMMQELLTGKTRLI